MASRKIEVEIVGNTRDFERAMDRASNKTSKFGSKLGGLAKGAGIGAAIGGIALLGKGLLSSVSAAKEAEQAQTRLQSALESSGISYAKHGAAIDDAIQKTSKLAALDDEELSDSFAKLVRTTGSVTKATEGMTLAADIARARNIDLAAATNIVEKASIGITKGLKGIGVELEKGATSTQALEAAQKKFGGAAEQYGKQATASQERLGVAFENLQEKVGAKLLPVLQKLSLKLIELIAWAEANWPKFAKTIEPVISKLDEFWKGVQILWKIVEPILAVALPLAFKLIGTQITIMIEIWKTMATVVATVVGGILKVVDKFLGGIQAIAEAASHLPFVGDKFKGVSEAIGRAREKVRELASAIDNLHDKDVTITVNTIHHEQSVDVRPGGAGGRAAGGPVRRGSSYVVGEKGPELFVPKSSGTIIPNGTRGSMAMVGGGGTVVNVYGDVTGQDLIETVRREINRIQKRNGTTGYV